MTDSVQIIPQLLHDARLIRLDWEPTVHSLRLQFTCLMRNVNGSAIPDPVVELHLNGIERIAAYYSPASLEVRPSELLIQSPLTEMDLHEWSQDSCEAFLSINSAHNDFLMTTSCALDRLFGDQPGKCDEDTKLGVHLTLDGGSYGKDAVSTGLYFGCDSIEPMMLGVPLSIDTWRQQFDSWWKGWQEHWDRQGEGEPSEGLEPILEDTLIPAGVSPPPDLAYRPPSEPTFQLDPTDTPNELLAPINDFHSALRENDWERMAKAYPNFDKRHSDRAEELSDIYQNHEFGRWIYVRQIDSWWVDGVRSCVIVRGIEHVMPDEEDPATNQETVITYGLLKSDQGWVISTWSQGWPQYGSAPKATGPQSWKDDWELDE